LWLVPLTEETEIENFDVVIVHLQQAMARTGREKKWLEMVRRGSESDPPVPVVWVSPLGDPDWIHRLIEAGISFLLPSPRSDSGEEASRFSSDLTNVVDRQLRMYQKTADAGLPASVSDLVGAILAESDSDRGVRSLLQLASEKFIRGAVLTVDDSGLRCRGGFGYPLNRNRTVLARGFEPLETVIESGSAVMGIESETDGTLNLAQVCGVAEMPQETALIPLGKFGKIAGVLVADREGEELPNLDELVVLAGRLGGAVVI
jgi:hypothetical protein